MQEGNRLLMQELRPSVVCHHVGIPVRQSARWVSGNETTAGAGSFGDGGESGKRDQLGGKLRERYGYEKEQAERELDEFFRTLKP